MKYFLTIKPWFVHVGTITKEKPIVTNVLVVCRIHSGGCEVVSRVAAPKGPMTYADFI